VGERRWDVVLDRDQRILLPETGAVEALEQVLALDEARDLLARNVTVVDMRLPHRPTLRLAPFAVEELRRVRSPMEPADQ
jgi:cell division protein FtsQ